ncbi:unnamed protein product [Hymenolepis diminuta]|uniref:Integrase catalytic domain-containing protein n=1 Tax=Hymenolepis diminuta TaxID=6216 RepID=A0A564Y6V4_HYMDI|nr:unnamed protein product [Hymenolepis diminuta]
MVTPPEAQGCAWVYHQSIVHPVSHYWFAFWKVLPTWLASRNFKNGSSHFFGFRLRAGKCVFFMPSIKYLGCIFDENGHRSDPEKLSAITEMPQPTDIITLSSFLSLINYHNCLSRISYNQKRPGKETVIAILNMEDGAQRLSRPPIIASDKRNAISKNSISKKPMIYVYTGWGKIKLKWRFHQLYLQRDYLSVVNSHLMFADHVVIHSALKCVVLEHLHSNHQGISHTKICCKKESNLWPITTALWSHTHFDFAGLVNGPSYLVVVDSYSCCSDNGTQFSSTLFQDFYRGHNTTHVYSPSYQSQSNGLGKRFVDTLKRALQRPRGDGTTEETPNVFLLMYRMMR